MSLLPPQYAVINPASVFDLVADVPRMDGAACVGRTDLFDAAVNERQAQRMARALCLYRCPAQLQCAEWLAGLSPSERPEGVVAGQVTSVKSKSKTKSQPSAGVPQKEGQSPQTASKADRVDRRARIVAEIAERRAKRIAQKAAKRVS